MFVSVFKSLSDRCVVDSHESPCPGAVIRVLRGEPGRSTPRSTQRCRPPETCLASYGVGGLDPYGRPADEYSRDAGEKGMRSRPLLQAVTRTATLPALPAPL